MLMSKIARLIIYIYYFDFLYQLLPTNFIGLKKAKNTRLYNVNDKRIHSAVVKIVLIKNILIILLVQVTIH